MFDLLFNEISIVIITAGILSLLFVLLKQPLIIAYIATGLLVGPSLLGLTDSQEAFAAMSEIGIAFLLFIVGLGLNWRNIKDVGKIAMLAGTGQVVFTSIIGYFIALAFGFDQITSVILGVGFAFSSTIVIVKLLSDKEDLDRFYGRISIGVLIVQDLIAMVVLLVISALADGSSIESLIIFVTLKSGIVLAVLWLLARFVLPHLFKYAAKSQELLFLTALAWCFAVASGLNFFGFGIEIGALLAGISLAGSEFHREIESKIRPLRDFFLIIFFIVLGTTLSVDSFMTVLPQALLFSSFILIGNPLIVIIILRLFGYHPRAGFMVGTTMAQISEFSFILFTAAIAAGLVPESILPMSTIVALVTIGVSTYLIKYNEQIYQKIEWVFSWMERGTIKRGKARVTAPHVALFGFEHLGEAILPAIKKMKKDYLVIDFDPVRIEAMKQRRIPAEYGDAGNEDFMAFIRLEKSKLVISTIPDFAVNMDLIAYLKSKRSRAPIVVTAKKADQASQLYAAGATFVIIPNFLGGELFAQMLAKRGTKKTSWGTAAKHQRKSLGA